MGRSFQIRKLRSEAEITANWNGDPGQPLVSICCTACNHERYIEDALEGFLAQLTDFSFEILVHDGGCGKLCVNGQGIGRINPLPLNNHPHAPGCSQRFSFRYRAGFGPVSADRPGIG